MHLSKTAVSVDADFVAWLDGRENIHLHILLLAGPAIIFIQTVCPYLRFIALQIPDVVNNRSSLITAVLHTEFRGAMRKLNFSSLFMQKVCHLELYIPTLTEFITFFDMSFFFSDSQLRVSCDRNGTRTKHSSCSVLL